MNTESTTRQKTKVCKTCGLLKTLDHFVSMYSDAITRNCDFCRCRQRHQYQESQKRKKIKRRMMANVYQKQNEACFISPEKDTHKVSNYTSSYKNCVPSNIHPYITNVCPVPYKQGLKCIMKAPTRLVPVYVLDHVPIQEKQFVVPYSKWICSCDIVSNSSPNIYKAKLVHYGCRY